MNKGSGVPITIEQAIGCLNIKPDDQVHSFTTGLFISGADLELTRVQEILSGAVAENRLFLSGELGGTMGHDVAAWDTRYRQWLFLECDPVKLEMLKRSLR